MATFLDLGLLEYFSPIFVFLLVFSILWALLEKTSFFTEDNKAVNALIAFSLSVLFILVPEVREIISLSIPWFIIFIIFLLMLIMIFIFVGVKKDIISDIFGGSAPGPMTNMTVIWLVIFVCLAIFGYAFTQVYGDEIHNITADVDSTEEGDLFTNIGQIIFTPKILGLILLIGLAGASVRFISMSRT